MRVIVVGGGVIGLCCAYELARSGAEVTVVERDRCGGAASLRNAGQIVPSLSFPLSAPGVFKQALGWATKRDSPLRLRASLDPDYLRWLWRFAKSSSPEKYRTGLNATFALGRDAPRLFDGLMAAGVEFDMYSKGLVLAALSPETLEAASETYADLRDAGYEGEFEMLDGESARRLEPALAEGVAGAVHFKDERHVRPESLVRGLSRYLVASGVRVLEETEVRGILRDGRGGWRVLVDGEDLVADRVLVAAGVWSKKLLADIGVRIPLEAGKGYSVTAVGRGTPPQYPLKLAEAQVVCVPYGTHRGRDVRLSGMFELVGLDASLDRSRLDAVIRSTTTYLRDWRPEEPRIDWAGLRPSTPDSLPLIGGVPERDGLYVATGHGTLGLTLAPGTAVGLARLILEDRPVPVLEPFRVDRFLYGRRRAAPKSASP